MALRDVIITEGKTMTDAIGPGVAPSVADVAHALAEARQASNRSTAAAAAQTPPAGRSGHEGDSVTLSARAQEAMKVQGPGGSELTPIPLGKLKLITPEGERSEAEAAIKQLMADLGIEGDLEFSIEMNDDGSVAVKGAGGHNADLEAAINADPALQRLMRTNYMSAKIAYTFPAMKELFSGGDDQGLKMEALKAATAVRDRVEAASFTFTLSEGVLTTAFVDTTGGRFGGVAPESTATQGA